MEEEVGHPAVAGDDEVGVELGERLESEGTLVQPRVRDRQPRLVDDDVVYQEEVEVDRPRAVPRPEARATELPLHLEERSERVAWRELRLDLDGAVEEGRLVEVADGIGLAERGDGDDLDPRLAPEQLDGAGQRRGAVTEVRPEADVRASHNGSLNRSRRPIPGTTRTTLQMRLPPLLAAATAATLLAVAPAGGATASRGTLVELTPGALCTDAAFVRASGGRVVAPELGLYAVPATHARRVVAALRQRGTLRLSTPDRQAGTLAVSDFGDPLVPTEWWRTAIGVDTLTPPVAGKAVTIVDSGIDVTHPDFLDRQNTETLNPQEPAGIGGEHGTAVGSLIAAPANGVGLVGIYPEALLRSWDAARGTGTQLDTGEIVQGILAAANAGPGIVNLSLGSNEKELVIEQAVYEAARKGTLVVAASGNDGDMGNPLGYPASIPHVLTVGASDRSSRIAGFSSRSRYVDLAAPGVGIPIATAIGNGWREGDGTSYAAPLVSGASAWVWTVRPELDSTQLFEVMRRSAVDIGAPGRDDAAGFGLLSVPAALAYPAPTTDPSEPNDDVEFVRPGGLYDNDIPPLTTPSKRTATVQARADRAEDPRDVYRVWLPKRGTVTATLTADTNLDLGLWKQGTASVIERIVGNDRLAKASTAGTGERLTFANKGAGRYAYLAVVFGTGAAPASTYSLRVR